MKLITSFEAATCTTSELRGLYQKTFNALILSKYDSAQRRIALASLENIERELAARCRDF